MKVIVIGAGSIGSRHAKNLADLGHDVYAVDIDKTKLDVLKNILKGTFADLKSALEISPDAAFICTPSNRHIEPATECAKKGCHVFIEKPLSTDLNGVSNLVEIVKKNGLVSMVGCNMRFHPAIKYIRDVLEENAAFRKKLWADLEFGFYLPFAKEDYESSYMAKRGLGGSIIFDVIHELDYALWFFGEPEKVFCTKGVLSDMKIDTEDFADIIIKFRSGTMCSIHMDYLQHGYSRRCKVVCDGGTIVWDFVNERMGIITAESNKWVWKDLKIEAFYNQMYVDEVKYFMECVKNHDKTFNSVADAVSVLKLALLANRSAETESWEMVK